jgi:hypothetical protein
MRVQLYETEESYEQWSDSKEGVGWKSVAEDACAVMLLTVKDADINKQNDQLIRDQPTNQH